MKLLKSLIIPFVLLFSLQTLASELELVEDFSFKDIKGNTHKFSQYRGKWVLVNFWGTYCAPCLEEIPDLVAFADRHKNDAVVLGMDAGGTPVEDLIEFADENMMDYTIAPVQQSTLTAFGILTGIPTTYIVTPQGEVAARIIGIVDLTAVEQFMLQYADAAMPDFEEDSGNILDM